MSRSDQLRTTALRAADQLGLLTYVGVAVRGGRDWHQVVLPRGEPWWIPARAVLPWLVGWASGQRRLEALQELVPGIVAGAGITPPPTSSTQG